MTALALIFATLLLQPIPGGTIEARVTAVYDGDTFTVADPVHLYGHLRDRVRVQGVDTPEIEGKCAAEIEQALRARDFARAWLGWHQGAEAPRVTLVGLTGDFYQDRFGARVKNAAGEDLAEALIKAGLGRPYKGKRLGWCGR